MKRFALEAILDFVCNSNKYKYSLTLEIYFPRTNTVRITISTLLGFIVWSSFRPLVSPTVWFSSYFYTIKNDQCWYQRLFNSWSLPIVPNIICK